MSLLLSRLAGEFQRRQPNVSINVSGGGSTKAVNEFIQPPAKLSGKIALKEERPTYVSLVASSRELLDAEGDTLFLRGNVEDLGLDLVALLVQVALPRLWPTTLLLWWLLLLLLLALPAFHLHQNIAYGGGFGELYTFGAKAYGLT